MSYAQILVYDDVKGLNDDENWDYFEFDFDINSENCDGIEWI